MRRGMAVLAVVAAALLALVGIVSASLSLPAAGPDDRVREVAQTLKCPSCVGESVADSAAPVSKAMRAVIVEQLDRGRTPGEIRAWFAERYGAEVLLDPSPFAGGWVLWIVPAAIIAAAVVLVVRRRRPRALRLSLAITGLTVVGVVGIWAMMSAADAAAPAATSKPAGNIPPADTLTVLRDAVDHDAGDPQLRLALARALDDAELLEEAAEHYATARRLRPLDTDIAYRHATVLVRAGDVSSAVPALEGVLALEPQHSPALLLLGTILWEGGDARGVELLEEFMALEPGHPASAEVSQLLSGAIP